MATKGPIQGPSPIGFDFSNYARNQFLGSRLGGLPKGEFLPTLHPVPIPHSCWTPCSFRVCEWMLIMSYLDWYYHCWCQIRWG